MTTLMRWNPFRDFDDFFERYYPGNQNRDGPRQLTTTDWSPMVDITEDDGEFLIKAELPGIEKKDIKINVNNGMLTITGERKLETEDKKHHRQERFYGSFSRSFSLPENVTENDISAEHKNGMLYLHLKKTEPVKSHSREIRIN